MQNKEALEQKQAARSSCQKKAITAPTPQTAHPQYAKQHVDEPKNFWRSSGAIRPKSHYMFKTKQRLVHILQIQPGRVNVWAQLHHQLHAIQKLEGKKISERTLTNSTVLSQSSVDLMHKNGGTLLIVHRFINGNFAVTIRMLGLWCVTCKSVVRGVT